MSGEKREKPRQMQVDVIYLINGTTHEDTYWCDHASSMMAGKRSGNASSLRFRNGRDDKGPVLSAQYREAEVIVRRTL